MDYHHLKRSKGKNSEDCVVCKESLPWHTSVLLTVVFIFFVSWIPAFWQGLDEVASIKTFTRSVFPDLISSEVIAVCRIIFSSVIFAVIFINYGGPGWTHTTDYKKGSKLHSKPMFFQGWGTMCYFTNWVWLLLGISFLLSGSIPLLSFHGAQIPKFVLKLAILSFETVAPLSLPVSTVVRYAIWDDLLKQGRRTHTNS